MVDFTTPNLLGASEEFNKLVSQFDSIKASLKGKLEAEIDDVKSEVGSSLSVLDADMKDLIPELPSIPDVSFISEIQNLAALPAGGFAGLSALANLQSQFGSALSGAGFSLDSLAADATAAFSGGAGLAGGGFPNFVIGIDGLPALKPDDVGMPSTDPERLDEDDLIEEEPASLLLTPAAEISFVNTLIASDVSTAVEKIKKATQKIEILIASESGRISEETKRQFDEADTIGETSAIKSGTAPTPQIAKVNSAVATNKTLPPKSPAIELTSDAAVEIESLYGLQDDIADFENNLVGEFQRLSDLLLKYKKESPFNLIEGNREIVSYPVSAAVLAPPKLSGISRPPGQKNIEDLYTYYLSAMKFANDKINETNNDIQKRLDFLQGGSITTKIVPIDGGTESRIIRAPDDQQKLEDRFFEYKETSNQRGDQAAMGGDILIESMDAVYTEAEKTFSIPRR